MSFDSIQFLLFFVPVVLIYWSLPHKWRIPFLLVGSYFFFSQVRLLYLPMILFSTGLDFFCGQKIGKNINRKFYLWLSITLNLGMLAFFKYLNFAIDHANFFLSFFSIDHSFAYVDIDFPIGISFYTLQTISYTIDVYRGHFPYAKNLTRFALFVCFFPQLVAGPLEKAGSLLTQFEKKLNFDYQMAREGVVLIFWGLFKKTVIADRLHMIIGDIYTNPEGHYSGMHIVAMGFFSCIKYYCDFSGYSDIAIGSARLIGIRLSQNFAHPFWSPNIASLWRRWHITLFRWLYDYVYYYFKERSISSGAKYKTFGVLAVFALSGIWHGANWTFVYWGLINGIAVVLFLATKKIRGRIAQVTGISLIPVVLRYPFCILMTQSIAAFSTIFFISPSIEDAIFQIAYAKDNLYLINFDAFYSAFGVLQRDVAIVVLSITLVELVNLISFSQNRWGNILSWPRLMRWPCYLILVLLVLMLSHSTTIPFLYFYF